MTRCYLHPIVGVFLLAGVSGAAHAAEIGSRATLTTKYHIVSGTVTIVDADLFRVDNFTYDGGGPSVYFYLGTSESDADLLVGLRVDPTLTGTAYDGSQEPLFYQLPAGQTFEAYQAIAVWCDDFNVNFGSGTFHLPGDLNVDGFVGLGDLDIVLLNWNRTVTAGDLSAGDATGDGYVGLDDLDAVLGDWNAGTPPIHSSVPEPSSVTLLSVWGLLFRRTSGTA